MKASVLFLSLWALCSQAAAGVGVFYDLNSMHVKIGKRPNPDILNDSGMDFTVSMHKWGVFDSTGVLASAMTGAANQYTARQEALRDAYVPADGQVHTITYSWNQPNLMGVDSYFAVYGSGETTDIQWSGAPPIPGKIKATVSGFDAGFALPNYYGLADDYGVTLGFSWDVYARSFSIPSDGFDDLNDTLISDPFFVHAIYQTKKFPWLAAEGRIGYAPIFGILSATVGGCSQMWGYGAGLVATPVTSLSIEAQYDTFNGSFIATNYRTISTDTLWYGVRWDILRFIQAVTGKS